MVILHDIVYFYTNIPKITGKDTVKKLTGKHFHFIHRGTDYIPEKQNNRGTGAVPMKNVSEGE